MGHLVCEVLRGRAPEKGRVTTGWGWAMKQGTMNARIWLPLLAISMSSAVQAATMSFGGSFRSEAASYTNLKLGALTGPISKNFIAGRALLNPNLVVDDHFSIKSQWSLLSSPSFTPRANTGLAVGQGSYVFGDNTSASLALSRAWLEWTSDIGVFRLGRMPVSWGYGVLYDSGESVWDDFQTTMDRIEYRLHLGYVVGALAYSKNRKISVQDNDNDQQFFTAYLRYDNPEVEIEAGVLFEQQNRAGNQSGDLQTNNPYSQASTTPIGQLMPSPLSNSVVDVYFKKTAGYFSYGAEVSWLSGSSTNNTSTPGASPGLNAFGALANAAIEYRKVKGFLEVLYATGDSDLTDANLTGFVLLNRNRRPGLILGRELLGPYNGNNVALGSPVFYGANNTFSGVLYFRPGVRFDWSKSLTSAIELIYARKVADAASAALDLGVELDIGTEYAVYKNFRLGLDVGLLLPGGGLQQANPTPAYAFRSTASLSF